MVGLYCLTHLLLVTANAACLLRKSNAFTTANQGANCMRMANGKTMQELKKRSEFVFFLPNIFFSCRFQTVTTSSPFSMRRVTTPARPLLNNLTRKFLLQPHTHTHTKNQIKPLLSQTPTLTTIIPSPQQYLSYLPRPANTRFFPSHLSILNTPLTSPIIMPSDPP